MDATFRKAGERFTLALERTLSHPPEKVWRVLTERDLLQQWFPSDVEGKWEVGAPLRFTFLHGEVEGLSDEDMRGEVLVVDPPHRLEFTWGRSHYRVEVTPVGEGGSRLRFSEELDDPSWGARNASGWEMCLDNLDLLLQGVSAAKFVAATWKKLFAKYVAKFEPEFGPQNIPPDELLEDRE